MLARPATPPNRPDRTDLRRSRNSGDRWKLTPGMSRNASRSGPHWAVPYRIACRTSANPLRSRIDGPDRHPGNHTQSMNPDTLLSWAMAMKRSLSNRIARQRITADAWSSSNMGKNILPVCISWEADYGQIIYTFRPLSSDPLASQGYPDIYDMTPRSQLC